MAPPTAPPRTIPAGSNLAPLIALSRPILPRNNMALPTATPTSPPIVAPPTVAQSTIPSNENSITCIVPYCEPRQNDRPGRYSNLKGGPDLATTKLRYLLVSHQ